MSRPGSAKRRARLFGHRTGGEWLEERVLPVAVNWLSAFGIGVSGLYSSIKSNSVASDSGGDTFITGSFRGTASFNPNAPSLTITTNNTQDTFIAKYSPTGSFDWVRTFAGTATTANGQSTEAVSQGSAIVVDPSGNLFVAGGFSGTVTLTGASGPSTISSPSATTEVYLAKLDPNGKLLWVDTVNGTPGDTDQAYALALDGSGGVVMAGSFADSATFGSTTLTAGGASEAFASRVNGSGQFLWSIASQGQAGSNAQINGVAVDSSGNVVLAGFFSGTVDLDPNASRKTLVSNGSDDALIWKVNSSGVFDWAQSFGSTDYDVATAVAVDPQGESYLTGAFSDSVTFGSTTLTAGPLFDAFVIKLSPTGAVDWADGLVGPGGWSKGQGIAVDPWGDVNLGGTFQGEVDFNPGPASDDLTSLGDEDAFEIGLDSSGNFLYGLQAGQTNFNATLGVTVNASGLLTATGTYSGSIAFGSSSLPAFPIASAFVATLQTPSMTPPTPSAPVLDPSSNTGTNPSNAITSVTSPLLDINTAVAGDTVELFRNGTLVGSRIGPGSILDPGPLTQGTYSYTAVQVSTSGVASQSSAPTSVTILTTPPAPPSVPKLDAADDSGTIGDGITNVRQPRISVVAPGGTTVQVLNSSGTVLTSTFATSSGTYTTQLPQPLADGTYLLQARLIDLAGNVSADSPTFSLTILATAPSSPSSPSILAADISGPVGGTLTNVRQPRLTGTAQSGTTVEIFTTTGQMIASAMVSNGTYTAKVSSPLSDGTYTVDAISIDVAANQSSPSATSRFTIDGTPPASPTGLTLLTADDSGVLGDGITNIRQPRLTGSAEAGSTVQIVDGTGKVYATAVATSSGSFTAQVSAPLADGTYKLQARATDQAGNIGPLGAADSLTILGTPPVAPAAPALDPADDSGTLNITNVNQPRLIGNAPPNTTVQIVGSTGQVDATVSSGSTGSYVVKVANPFADGTYVLHAVATDVAGNVSPAGPSFSLTILTSTPATPSAPALLAADDSGVVGDDITNVRQPRLTGTASAKLTIQLVNSSNAVIGTGSSGSNGAVTIVPSNPLADGTYLLHFVAINAAGTSSAPGSTLKLVILGTPPTKPSPPTLLAADGVAKSNGTLTTFSRPTVIGNASPGDLVAWISSTGSVIASATAAVTTGSYQLQPASTLINGTYAIEVRQTDVAGNVSPLSLPLNLTIRIDPDDNFGTGQSDLAVFGTNNETFAVQNPLTHADFSQPFGLPGDIPISGDFFGNGRSDIAVYRPSNSTFYVYDPISGAHEAVAFGQPGDVPVPGDYDGDGLTDFAVFQPSNDTFSIKMSATNTVYTKTLGQAGDIPVPADYYGDGHDDIAIYRPTTSTFSVFDQKTSATESVQLAVPNAVPIPGDYEGLGHADFALFQPSTDNFVIKLSATTGYYVKPFAIAGDIPVPGDYFGDGRADLAVFRPSTSTYYAFDLANGAVKVNQWGSPGQVKPLLAPISNWYNFNVGGNAYSIATKSSSTPELLVANLVSVESTEPSDDPEPVVASPDSIEASDLDLAIESLSLERWKLGS